MTKITIREVDETTVGNVVIESTDVVYVPGFSVLNQTDDSLIGAPHVPILCKTISEFETYFGSSAPTFSSNQTYPSGFSALAIPTDIGGTPQYMFKKDDPDPSYIYAKELIASGLPVLYERINEIGENIEVSKMYSALSTIFNKNISATVTQVASYATPYSSTATYTTDDYCSYEGRNYKCTTAIATPEEWNPAHWEVSTSYRNFKEIEVNPYTFYDIFYDEGNYKFVYSKYPNITLEYTGIASNMAPEYDAKSTYVVSSHCTYAGNIYTCVTQTTGEWNPEDWILEETWKPTTFVTFDEEVWSASYPVDNEDYTFTYNSSAGDSGSWQSSSVNVNLDALGIIVKGSIPNGSTITINNDFIAGWVLSSDNHLYNLTDCGVTYVVETGRTLHYGDYIAIYLESSDALLLDRGLYSFKYLTTGGYPVFEYEYNSIGKQMANLCYTRGDAVALIDHTDDPARSLTGLESVYYVMCTSANMIPTAHQSFAAMFTPSVEMSLINSYRGWSWSDSTRVKLPSTCVLPASFAYLSCLASAIKVFPNWNAIAGATRGKVTGLVAPRTVKALTNAIADSFTPDTKTAINPITNIKPYGQCIWGNRTLVDNSIKQGTTATSFLNIRNLVSDVKKQLFVACQSLLFEQNTDVLWVNFLSLITPILDKMVSGFGIHNYKIIKLPNSDKTQINVKIRLYPIYAVESFDITIYLNDKGVYLDTEE